MHLSIDGVSTAGEAAVLAKDGAGAAGLQSLEPNLLGRAQVEVNDLLLKAAHQDSAAPRIHQQTVHVHPAKRKGRRRDFESIAHGA